MNEAPRPRLLVARFAAIGLIAASAAWFVNELAVWQLGRHTPKPTSAAATPKRSVIEPPTPTLPAPQPLAPEVIVEEPSSVQAEPQPEPTAEPARKHAAAKPKRPPARRGPKVRTFVIDKAKLTSKFKKPADTAGHGRIYPNYDSGERRGLRFEEVAPGGIFARLGIQSGDVILSVNDVEITTQQKALSDFEKMRQMRTFDVILERGGTRRHHRYVLR